MPKDLVFACLLILFWSCSDIDDVRQSPERLRTEYQENPLGIDRAQPRFFWEVSGEGRNLRQSAYQLLVASSEEKLQSDEADIWDSGKISSSENIQIAYDGPVLQSRTRYYWMVRIWDEKDQASAFSEAAWFETALLDESDWQAQWIGDGRPAPEREEDFYGEIPNPIFRKTFSAEKNIAEARLYISGLGYYEAYLNGEKIGNHVLEPGWTNYGKRVLYSTYDVSEMLQQGENALGVSLGNGWYNPLPLGLFRRFNLRKFLTIGQPKFIAQLHIRYEDGSEETILSDENWKASTGPFLKNNVYLGEVYDARLEQPGWKTTGFDDSQWAQAVQVSPPGGKMLAQMAPPIRITKTLQPVEVWQTDTGSYVFDLGQNFAGWIRLQLPEGESGTEVKMRYGELVYDNGHVNGMTTVAGHIKEIWNLSGGPGAPPTAYQEDTYIMKGDGTDEFQQQFGFHGFRYVEVSGYPGQLDKNSLVGLRLNSDLEDAAHFEASNPMLNDIQRITEWAMLSNVFSVQSDCPGREKFGYGGDIVTAGEAYLYNYDMANFYIKTVRDFQDDARPNGGLPETAPFNGIDTEGFGEGSGPIGWQLAHPFTVMQLYKYYGDQRIVEEQYETSRRMLEFLQTQAQDYFIERGIGDHVSVSYKAVPLTSTAFYYHIAQLQADFAEILGKEDDLRRYSTLASNIKEAFISRFYDAETAILDTAVTQANQVFGLYYDLVPSEDRQKVLQVLLDDIHQTNKGHISTGIFGTKMIWNVLDAYDQNETAYTMITQTDYPGYGYMLANDATTLWEHWDKSRDQNSKNHPMFGSVSEWFYKSLLGIQQQPDAVAYDKILIKPSPAGDLQWAKGYYQSVRGRIGIDWKREEDELHIKVEIPGNTEAQLALPLLTFENPRIEESGKMVLADGNPDQEVEGLSFEKAENGRAYFQAGSGTYHFVVKNGK
ncbi:MAG: family 78 glycoside hydrolase catalytic domain [Cyclobacteriaceae bacterium]